MSSVADRTLDEQAAAVLELVVRTDPFEIDTSRGTLRGRRQHVPSRRPVGTVVVAPPFGVQMRKGAALALYFLFNGYDVVRYDPTNHVGIADGDIADLTPSGLAEDLRLVVEWAAANGSSPSVCLFSTSISTRLTFAMLARAEISPIAVGAISAVVDMAGTIEIATEQDLVQQWTSGRETDLNATRDVLGHEIKMTFIDDLVTRGWGTTESVEADLAAMGPVPLLTVQGAKDDWVDVEEAKRVFGATGNGSVVVLSDAVHALNPASARTAMTEIVRFFNQHCGAEADATVVVPQFPQIVAQSKSESRIDGANPPSSQEITHHVSVVHQARPENP
jgi:alpha-beta hydrolase superfamily lysophospholipase